MNYVIAGLDPAIQSNGSVRWPRVPGSSPGMTIRLRASGGLGLGHAERVEIGVEHRHLLPPFVLILFADADHGAQRLHVEAIALRLGIDFAEIGGERRFFLLEPLDAGDNGTKLALVDSGAARSTSILLTIDLPRSLGGGAITGQRAGNFYPAYPEPCAKPSVWEP